MFTTRLGVVKFHAQPLRSDAMGLVRTIEPAVEPATLQEVKTHARVVHTDEDVYIESLIKSARSYCETFTRRSIITQTWQLTLFGFPRFIVLPNPTLQSVTSIQYIDIDGATQTLSTDVYAVDTTVEPGVVSLKTGQSWPQTSEDIAAVTVTYVGGYGDARTDVPDSYRHAIKFLAAHWFELREPVLVGTIVAKVPLSVESLLWSNRVMEVA